MEERWLTAAKQGRCLPETDLLRLCERAKSILIEENNIQPVSTPVNICGNIHGQFYDLLKLFRTGGEVPDKKYIFMGDYVNRGYQSVESFQLLLALKVRYPQRITLLRGNHESRQMTRVDGLYNECLIKYGNSIAWKCYVDVFDYLNVAAVVDNTIFCIHGGLSPDLCSLDQIRALERRVEVPPQGALCDLLWSDPDNVAQWTQSPRGAGWLFGSNIAEEFCHINDLILICRGHQLVMEGYKFWFPLRNLVTVWSAPDYCCRCGNVAAILTLDEALEPSFQVFDEGPGHISSYQFRSQFPDPHKALLRESSRSS